MSLSLYLRFYECEHQGNLNHYISNLARSGATVLEKLRDIAA